MWLCLFKNFVLRLNKNKPTIGGSKMKKAEKCNKKRELYLIDLNSNWALPLTWPSVSHLSTLGLVLLISKMIRLDQVIHEIHSKILFSWWSQPSSRTFPSPIFSSFKQDNMKDSKMSKKINRISKTCETFIIHVISFRREKDSRNTPNLARNINLHTQELKEHQKR